MNYNELLLPYFLVLKPIWLHILVANGFLNSVKEINKYRGLQTSICTGICKRILQNIVSCNPFWSSVKLKDITEVMEQAAAPVIQHTIADGETILSSGPCNCFL
jgi:hypothetical protein